MINPQQGANFYTNICTFSVAVGIITSDKNVSIHSATFCPEQSSQFDDREFYADEHSAHDDVADDIEIALMTDGTGARVCLTISAPRAEVMIDCEEMDQRSITITATNGASATKAASATQLPSAILNKMLTETTMVNTVSVHSPANTTPTTATGMPSPTTPTPPATTTKIPRRTTRTWKTYPQKVFRQEVMPHDALNTTQMPVHADGDLSDQLAIATPNTSGETSQMDTTEATNYEIEANQTSAEANSTNDAPELELDIPEEDKADLFCKYLCGRIQTLVCCNSFHSVLVYTSVNLCNFWPSLLLIFAWIKC